MDTFQEYDESWSRSADRTVEELNADLEQIIHMTLWLLKRRKHPARVLEERDTEGRIPVFRPV